jgi:hypothetical protein
MRTRKQDGEFGIADVLRNAKKSEEVRLELLRAILDPDIYTHALPTFKDSEIVAAIRICGEGILRWPLDSEGYGEWMKFRDACVAILKGQVRQRPPLTLFAIRAAQRLSESWPPRRWGVNVRLIQEDLHSLASEAEEQAKIIIQVTKLERESKVARVPHRGRRFGHQEQQIIAALQLLRVCKDANRYATVKKMLTLHAVSKKAGDLKRLEKSYKTANARMRADAYLTPEALLWSWLDMIMDRR